MWELNYLKFGYIYKYLFFFTMKLINFKLEISMKVLENE